LQWRGFGASQQQTIDTSDLSDIADTVTRATMNTWKATFPAKERHAQGEAR
jgi:hypothetical protein